MKPFKACSCRDPDTGLKLGKKCPNLTKKNHGKWYIRYEAPAGPNGERTRPRIGPFDTSREAKTELANVLGGTVATTTNNEDRKLKLGAYLDRWHVNRLNEAQNPDGGLAASTLEAEAEAIDLYLKPGLGHISLGELRSQQVRDLYAVMRKINRPVEREDRSDLLRALQKARASQGGKRTSTRPIGESRIKRINAVLSAALSNAVNPDHLIAANPASGIFKSKGTRRATRTKPLLWTAERVEHWERTGRKRAKVMTWTQAQAGSFLDFCEATGERLYALFTIEWITRRHRVSAEAVTIALAAPLPPLNFHGVGTGRRACCSRRRYPAR